MKKIGRFIVSGSLLIASVTTLCSFAEAHSPCQKEPITPAQETVKGNGFLCVGHGDVNARLDVSGLIPGDAYTFWFIYIPDGTACAADEATCFGANSTGGQQDAVPAEAFGRMSDVVAPRNGRATLSGDVPDLQLASGSQVWLLLKGHGAANTSDDLARARQLLTPEDPTIGAPNLGIVGGSAADNAGLAVFNN